MIEKGQEKQKNEKARLEKVREGLIPNTRGILID
jgi:hypothetical protein